VGEDYFDLIKEVVNKLNNSKIRYFYKEKQTNIEDYLNTIKSKENSLQQIAEAKQIGDLYHFTSFHGLHNILAGEKLESRIRNKDGNFVISLTRDKKLDVKAPQISSTDCRITLDGNKLSEHYKIVPFNDPSYSFKGQGTDSRTSKGAWVDTFEAEEQLTNQRYRVVLHSLNK
jgi:hypothetical protein